MCYGSEKLRTRICRILHELIKDKVSLVVLPLFVLSVYFK